MLHTASPAPAITGSGGESGAAFPPPRAGKEGMASAGHTGGRAPAAPRSPPRPESGPGANRRAAGRAGSRARPSHCGRSAKPASHGRAPQAANRPPPRTHPGAMTCPGRAHSSRTTPGRSAFSLRSGPARCSRVLAPPAAGGGAAGPAAGRGAGGSGAHSASTDPICTAVPTDTFHSSSRSGRGPGARISVITPDGPSAPGPPPLSAGPSIVPGRGDGGGGRGGRYGNARAAAAVPAVGPDPGAGTTAAAGERVGGSGGKWGAPQQSPAAPTGSEVTASLRMRRTQRVRRGLKAQAHPVRTAGAGLGRGRWRGRRWQAERGVDYKPQHAPRVPPRGSRGACWGL